MLREPYETREGRDGFGFGGLPKAKSAGRVREEQEETENRGAEPRVKKSESFYTDLQVPVSI